MLKRAILLALGLLGLSLSHTYAVPATATDNVKLRTGPGTGYSSAGTIPADAQIELKGCDEAGAWCAVDYAGKSGFVSGKYLNQADADTPNWPRAYDTSSGGQIVLYQPQVSGWTGFANLTALVASEYKATKDAKPAFGVITLTGDTTDDHDTGEVILTNVQARQIEFSSLDRNQLSDLSLQVGKLLPTGPLTLSEERLTASLTGYQKTGNVEGLKSDPPPIFFSTSPAVLLQTDGKETVAPVKGDAGLSFVINTNWDLFKLDADGSYYLRDDKSWLTSKSLQGEWSPAASLPDPLSHLPDEDNWKDARTAVPPVPFPEGQAPKVFYSDKPAELIQFKGDPKYEPVPGTGLEWVSNSDGDVFRARNDGTVYILLSGRWFSAKSLDGPWTFTTPTLPNDFRNIPDDAPYYSVRSSVPGTSENAEARLKASIPQTARVATDGSVTVDVAYGGTPDFKPIDGTTLGYAVNTNETVIKVGSKYYVLKDGIWFVGDSPEGPFAVAKSVPDEIYKIPPSSPVYNATYVRVYKTEDDAVWYGYTLGYLGAYLAWDALVYGTGWAYAPYWDYGWAGPGYWPYYPRPVTYGMGAFYNPVRGTFGRYGYAYGPYRGIAAGAAYNPRTGTYFRGAAIAGPAGERGFVGAYNPRTNTGAFARGGSNIYGSWKSAGVRHGSDWARAGGGSLAGGGEAARWRTSAGNSGFIAQGKGGDVYAGRDGNVYRRDNGQWQKHTSDGWGPVQKPSKDNLKRPGEAENRIANRAQGSRANRAGHVRTNIPDNLGFDRNGRLRGNQRALANRAEFHPQFRGGGFNRGGNFGAGHGGSFHGGGAFRGGGFHGGGFHRR
ncbi:SH3 domain-containing protein [Mesorhizobium koreense]|uniref:SH3 domain-containing protein n=1 Tax=Mesorhizobium koreense TaxID=3074855 RepID=UPI00287B7E44|nr:SH3 domain-containing protein [Mesorhizobium sp. WR6]